MGRMGGRKVWVAWNKNMESARAPPVHSSRNSSMGRLSNGYCFSFISISCFRGMLFHTLQDCPIMWSTVPFPVCRPPTKQNQSDSLQELMWILQRKLCPDKNGVNLKLPAATFSSFRGSRLEGEKGKVRRGKGKRMGNVTLKIHLT